MIGSSIYIDCSSDVFFGFINDPFLIGYVSLSILITEIKSALNNLILDCSHHFILKSSTQNKGGIIIYNQVANHREKQDA